MPNIGKRGAEAWQMKPSSIGFMRRPLSVKPGPKLWPLAAHCRNRPAERCSCLAARDAAITNDGSLEFYDSSTAGNATITNNDYLGFYASSTAGDAAVINGVSGTVDFSRSTGPNNDNKLSAGSITGAGHFFLGANQLTVGSSGWDTVVSGIISDCGPTGNECDNAGATGGVLVKTGAGTLILSGDNTYSGGTAISGGTLQLGNGGATGSIVGNVVNDGALAFNRSNDLTFAGNLSGSGSVRQIGSGKTELTGDSSGFTGSTTKAASWR